MKIAYNPESANALTEAPSNNDITFDLAGKAIYAKGVKFEGTNTTYSVFKKHTSDNSGGYDGLVPVPSYTITTTRYLREDGTWTTPPTYGVFTGATDSEEGKIGLVPAPKTTDVGKVLSAGGDWVAASLVGHVHSTKDITSLTDYTKSTTASDIAVTDTLNTALGKLEYKADCAYKWVINVTAPDTDEYINKWDEIVDFLNGVPDTTLNGILANFVKDLETTGEGNAVTDVSKSDNKITVTKGNSFLPLSGGTLTGKLIIDGSELNIKHTSDTPLKLQGVLEDECTIKFQGTDSENGTSINFGWLGISPNGAFFENPNHVRTLIWHEGNLTKLSQLTDDVVSGNYLPLTGGLMNSDAYISWNNGDNGNDISDWKKITGNGLRIISSTTTTSNAPTQYSTALHVRGRYGFQLASAGGVESNSFYIRNLANDNWYTLIHSGNIGALSVNYATSAGHANTAGNASNASKLTVHDVRNEARDPNYFDGSRVTAWFNNKGTPSTNWHSGIHVKGWTNGYTSWELCSYSSTGTDNDYDLYFRSGNNTTWGNWKTIITSGNIGSQSVNYANTAGSANSVAWVNVSGKPTLFTANGSTGKVDLNTIKTNGSYYISSDATNNPGSYGELLCISNVDTHGQIYIPYSAGAMKFRGANDANGYYDWRTILDSSNYTNYTVKKDGTGASGTWGINISGTATSSTLANYSRNLLGRKTSGDDYDAVAGNLIFAEWNTHNDNRWYLKAEGYETRVGYANDSDKLDGIDSTKFLRQVSVANNSENDFNSFSDMTLTGRGDPTTGASLKNAPWTGSGPAGGYGVLTYLWRGYGTLMAWGYNSNRIYIRPKYYANSTATWSSTWDSLALTSEVDSLLTKYLPLAGGTMTGAITTPGNDTVVIKPAKNNYDQIGGEGQVFYKIWATNFYGTLHGNADSANLASILKSTRYDTNDPSPNTSVGVTFQFSNLTSIGYHNVLTMKSYADNNYTAAQLITPASNPGKDSEYSGDMKWRQGRNSTWLDWKTILDSSNYSSFIGSYYIPSHEMMNSAYACIPTYNGENGWHRIATIKGSVGYGSYILYLCGNWSHASNTNAIIHIDTMHTTAQLTQISGIVGYVTHIRLVNISNNEYYVDVYINYSGSNTPGSVYCYFLGNGTITPRTTVEKITSAVTASAELTLAKGGFSHASAALKDSNNGNNITACYSTGGFSYSPSWLAAWNGYHLTYVAPSVLSVNYATSSGTATGAYYVFDYNATTTPIYIGFANTGLTSTTASYLAAYGTTSSGARCIKDISAAEAKKFIGLGNVQNTAFYKRVTTVNGTGWDMAGTLNSAAFTIYAPTTAGTAGLVLTSTGGTPGWSNQSDLSVGSATHIKQKTSLNNLTIYKTVKAIKDLLVTEFANIPLGIGANVTVPEKAISNWDNEDVTLSASSIYSMIKIGGGYSGTIYGQWLLSSYNLSRIGYVGRNSSTWSSIKWIATTDDLANYMKATKVGDYYGLTTPTGSDSDWIRTTSNGLIPYEAGGITNGHCSIGTSGWYFNSAYITTVNCNTVESSANLLVNGKNSIQLKTNDNKSAVVLNTTLFKPFDTAHDKLSLGSNTARWANTYSVLGNFSGQITSSVATGTSPFSITSTTKNTNLNADMLDGYHIWVGTQSLYNSAIKNNSTIYLIYL